MKIVNYEFPKSSFLSVQKDLETITNKIMQNERLKRLLYYTTPDALERPRLSESESLELFKKHIKIIPKLEIDREVLNYLVISFHNFLPNDTNPEFRDNTINFLIMCHYDQWDLKDFRLRPYLIAAEIDSMLNNKVLSGIGKLQFVGADPRSINDEFGCIILTYEAIHGEEDKKLLPNPVDNETFIREFDEIWNSKN